MQFHGMKIDFIGLGQAFLGLAALITALKGAIKSKRMRETKRGNKHERNN
jgi:hypothetical protein